MKKIIKNKWKIFLASFFVISSTSILLSYFLFYKNLERKLKIYKTNSNNPFLKLEIFDYQNTLSEREINQLVKLIESELPFGPEMAFLKKIKINQNIKLISQNEGSFISNFQEIHINTMHLNKLNSNEKIQRIFQIIFHEYFHYIEFSYLQSKDGINFPLNSKKYNSQFVNEFLVALNLSENNQKLFAIDNLLNEKDFFYNKNFYLFWKKINTQGWKENDEYQLNPTNNQLKYSLNFDKNNLNYYFSFEETLAREAFKHFYINNFKFNDETYNNFLKEWSLNSLLEKENNEWKIKNTFNLNNAFGNFYLKDLKNNQKTFISNKIEKFYNVFLKYMNYGSNISQIFIQDDSEILSNDKKIFKRNFNKIKFTGYSKEKFSHLIFKNKKGEFIKIPLTWNQTWNFKGKKSFNSKFLDLFPKENYYSYISDEFLDINDLDLNFYPHFYNQEKENEIIFSKLKKVIITNDLNPNLEKISSYRNFHENLENKKELIITKDKIIIN